MKRKTGIDEEILKVIIDSYWDSVIDYLAKGYFVYTGIGRLNLRWTKGH
jgi:hypothetical protein